MKLVILVSFLLVLPMFSSGIVENLHLHNVNRKVKEVVMNGRRIDLEMDYDGPHVRPPKPSDPIHPRTQVDEVVTKELTVYDYGDFSPRPVLRRPMPYVPPPPPPPSRRPPFTINH
ncbi:hypothetical protein ISN45_Aa06g023890 [Arabidopsis thaliana x Arabidopsis arenosa]|uniref:Transmembrane protein n=1 Tax=Arabidopsis thaliana x Arabidopsis arenosa TaxID=1240361 RepID=A0A8T1Z0N5_9BRAS|nr:hypothetical protein ISN45_Aa06g023890 [Arabidopsis thaliana x Arabidopsis arenosa]